LSIYSTCFFSGAVSALNTALWNPSEYMTVVIRDIEAADRSGDVNNITVWTAASGSLATQLHALIDIPAYGTSQWTGRIVLLPGTTMGANASYYPFHLHISGYNLTT
jgi:hypothetical protein